MEQTFSTTDFRLGVLAAKCKFDRDLMKGFHNEFKKQVKACGNEPWTDPDFPPNKNSLIHDWHDKNIKEEYKFLWKHFTWERSTKVKPLNEADGPLALFYEKIEPADVI